VSQPDELTRAAVAAIAIEIALPLCGLGLIVWRFLLGPGARARREARLAEWRLPPIDFGCFLCFGFLGATALSGTAGLAFRHVAMGADATAIVGYAAMEGGFLLGIAAFYGLFGARVRGAAGPPSLLAALKSGLATFLIAMPLVDAVNYASEFAITRMGFPNEKQEIVDIFENIHSPALRWLFVALAAFLVPAAEEILFRAGLFRYFRTRMPRWIAIGLTSALFGALHVAWGEHLAGLPSLLPLVALAVVFCLAYERTGMIGTTIVAHALFNLNSMFLVVAGIGS
jgi:membrane protease YdiL (CAAX protease family)